MGRAFGPSDDVCPIRGFRRRNRSDANETPQPENKESTVMTSRNRVNTNYSHNSRTAPACLAVGSRKFVARQRAKGPPQSRLGQRSRTGHPSFQEGPTARHNVGDCPCDDEQVRRSASFRKPNRRSRIHAEAAQRFRQEAPAGSATTRSRGDVRRFPFPRERLRSPVPIGKTDRPLP
jgi:hypothetical protein